MAASNKVFRSHILYRGIYMQHIYHHAKSEFSSSSSLANTRELTAPSPELQGTKKTQLEWS